MGNRGGKTSTTWKPSWNKGKTTVIRVPEVLADQLMLIARTLDNDEDTKSSLVTGNEDKPPLEDRSESELNAKLLDILTEWDVKTFCDDYSKNPRKKLAREFWLELKSLFD